jgi:hypothetical protein
LAKALLNNGFSVKGSTTSTDKIVVLENAEYRLSKLCLTVLRTNTGVVRKHYPIIDIPPKLRGDQSEICGKIKNLLPFIENRLSKM